MKNILQPWQSCATIQTGLKNTTKLACKLHDSELFSRPNTSVYGRDGQNGNAWRTTNFVFLTSRPPIDRKKSMCGYQSQLGAFHMATAATTPTTGNTTTSSLTNALRAILIEVTPGTRPFSTDSYLPDHLVNAARAALAQHDSEASQHAFNALSTAAYHCARGEPAKALSRMRRAQAHILASMEVSSHA